MNEHDRLSPKHSAKKANRFRAWAENILAYSEAQKPKAAQYYRQMRRRGTRFFKWFWTLLNYPIVDNNSATALAGLLIFLVTCVYAYYAYLQWDATNQSAQAALSAAQTAQQSLVSSNKSAHDTLVEMQKQSAAMKQSADASFSQAKTSREALISVQRAYISFSGQVGYEKIIEDGKVAEIRLVLPWVNDGVTPTKAGATGYINWRTFSPTGMPLDFNFPNLGGVIPTKGLVAAHGGIARGTMNLKLWTIEAALNKGIRLYVDGWFVYRDVFKGTPVHLNEFCDEITDIKVQGDLRDSAVNNISSALSLCPAVVGHNCSDEDCNDYNERTKAI